MLTRMIAFKEILYLPVYLFIFERIARLEGHLISEQIWEEIEFQNSNENIARNSALKVFID